MRYITLVIALMFSFVSGCSAKSITLNYDIETVYHSETSLDEQKLNIEKNICRRLIEEIEEQYGTAITSYTEVRNFVLVEDIIAKSTSVGVKIKKKKHTLTEQNGMAVIRSEFTFVVDTDKIIHYRPDLERLRRVEESLKQEKERNRQLDQDLSKQKEINSMLDYAPATGRDKDSKGYQYLMNTVVPLLNAGRIDQAYTAAQTCRTFFQADHPEYEYYLGLILLEMKQYQQAHACFDRAYALHPTARYLKSKGDALFYLGNYEGARQTYERVIAIKQNSAAAWANLGACLWYLQGHENVNYALTAYDKACEIGGVPRARAIRNSLETQYTPGQYRRYDGKRKKYARLILPLC